MKPTLYAMDTHFMCDPASPSVEDQAACVKAAGYDDFYVTSDLETPEKSLDYARASQAAGLGFNAVYMRLDASVTPREHHLNLFRQMLEGIRPPTRVEFSVWHGAFDEKTGDPSADPGALRWLRFLLPSLEERGIRACLYPHFGFSLETMGDALRLLEALPHELLGAVFCGYHWYRVDRTPVRELLASVGDRLFAVNLSGSSFVGPGREINGLDPLIQPLDEGDLDNADVVAALREFGYAGPVGVQGYGVTAPAREALIRSATALRRWLATST